MQVKKKDIKINMWMLINKNIKKNKMQGEFKMHKNDKKWDAGSAGSKQEGAAIKKGNWA